MTKAMPKKERLKSVDEMKWPLLFRVKVHSPGSRLFPYHQQKIIKLWELWRAPEFPKFNYFLLMSTLMFNAVAILSAFILINLPFIVSPFTSCCWIQSAKAASSSGYWTEHI